jgi:phosphatidylglycerophosphate synthase
MSVPEEVAARRPLKSRSTWWAAWLSSRLVRMNLSPNAISMVSIVFAAIAAGAFIGTRYVALPIGDALLFVAAIVGIQGRLLCNMMDGMVAVEGGKRTPSGELFNEVPDRVADTLILVAAGYIAGPHWGPWIGYVAAILAMLTAYIRTVGVAAGAKAHFEGIAAKPRRMALLTAACAVAAVLTFYSAADESMSMALVLVSAGCVETSWRRLSGIVRDLRSE